MKASDKLSALIETARKGVVQKKPWASWSKLEQLRADADALMACASEVRAAYQEQLNGEVNWRLTRDDVSRITRVALSLQHTADVWEWQQHPGVAQRLRSGLSFDNVEGLPPRPIVPECGLATPAELPAGFPQRCLSWSEMATDFLQTRRGVRGGADDARGLD